MIHYHGSPCGGVSSDLPRFYNGRHALISYAFPEDTGVILECCQTFCLDNGAWSFFKSGTAVDWGKYIDWVRSLYYHPSFDFWLIPDIIDGDEKDNLGLVKKYGDMIPCGVPVYHLHESTNYLQYLSETFPKIAIGSSGAYFRIGSDEWWKRMNTVMDVLCYESGKPKNKIHGLRMLDPEIFTKIPLSSADSTNAVFNARSNTRFGIYRPPTAAQRATVIADRIEAFNSPAVWTSTEKPSFNLFNS